MNEPESADLTGFGTTRTGEKERVDYVEEGSVAEKAGLHEGDLLVRMNGTPIPQLSYVRYRQLKEADASKLTLSVERDGKTRDVVLNLRRPLDPFPMASLGGKRTMLANGHAAAREVESTTRYK